MKILIVLMKRTLRLGLLAFTVTSATFFLVSLIPGDFFTALEANPNIRPETVARLREQYGLGDPVYLQYVHWLQRSLHLDFRSRLRAEKRPRARRKKRSARCR